MVKFIRSRVGNNRSPFTMRLCVDCPWRVRRSDRTHSPSFRPSRKGQGISTRSVQRGFGLPRRARSSVRGPRLARRTSRQGQLPLDSSWDPKLRVGGWHCQPIGAGEASRETRYVGSALSLSNGVGGSEPAAKLSAHGDNEVRSIGDESVCSILQQAHRVLWMIDRPNVDAETRAMGGVYPRS